MENDQSDLDNDHFEDDLSYMYDLDARDYNHHHAAGYHAANRRSSIFADEEEGRGGENESLLMKVINENEKAQEKRNEAYEKRHYENEEKIKRLEEAISQLTNRSTYHTYSFSNTRPMDGFDDESIRNEILKRQMEAFLEDDIVSEGEDDIVIPGFSNASHKLSKSITNPGMKNPELSKSIMRSSVAAQQNSTNNVVMGFTSLSQDTYNLMMLSDGFFHRDWQLGFVVFLFQLGLGVITLDSQLVSSESDFNDTIFQIPIRTKTRVTILQLLAIFVAVYSQEDVFNAIAFPIDFRLNGPHPWGGIPIAEADKRSRSAWILKILIPNLFKCIQGFTVFLAALIIIIQSTNFIDLLKDFTSLYVISSIDDITFSVARRGFFGNGLLVKAARAEEIEISSFSVSSEEAEDGHRRWSNGTIIKTTVLHTILALSVSAWIIVVVLQGKGFFADLKYPKCESAVPSFKSEWKLLENNNCDIVFNHPDCAYDGGDCSEFNLIYPGCEVEDISLLGNGECDGSPYDSKLCRFDGGDCSIENVIKAKYPLCEQAAPSFRSNWTLVENEKCDMIFNIPECGMDGGDCVNFNLFYPGCNEVKDFEKIDSRRIGDGICDGHPYNSAECLYDGGDCRVDASYCASSKKGTLGDGICDDELDTWECYFDRGDCLDSTKKIPRIGDGNCTFSLYQLDYYSGSNAYYLDLEYEGGDCIHPGYEGCTFTSSHPEFVQEVGDGKCHNTWFHNKEECGWDGGDCIEFNGKYPNCKDSNTYLYNQDVEYYGYEYEYGYEWTPEKNPKAEAWRLGDGECNAAFNTSECGYDEGDCCIDARKDEICDSEFNTIECGWDKGDCIEFNAKYPNCTVDYPSWIGDGKCDFSWINTEECGWDGGDCIEFNTMYPNCTVGDPSWIGDAECDGTVYNNEECGWDGGDCLIADYPDCHVDDPSWIGNGNCELGAYNTEECGWDGGDCIEFYTMYPNCTVDNPSLIGDGKCDFSRFNTEECGWDGGDCIEFNTMYPNCTVDNPSLIGNGNCEPGTYNTEECGWDGGDCLIADYPDCHVDDPSFIGDGQCERRAYNTEECGWDGGDCLIADYPDCHVDYPSFIGDAECDGTAYNTEECGFDGGDCVDFNTNYPNCTVDDPSSIGNGFCSGGAYNTEECGFDGGDCIEFNTKYPNCTVDYPSSIGNGVCSGGAYNTKECRWDGGDCFIAEYPDCHVDNPSSIGNEICQKVYNTKECGWDGLDCIDFNAKYPNCTVDKPSWIGDGQCDGRPYNSEECGWDGGDCLIVDYPDCHVDYPSSIGNGFCEGGVYNTEECGWDGGDCVDFNAKYPNCTVDYPYLIGDGSCVGGEYNTKECGFEEGDCIDFNTKYPNCTVDYPFKIGNGRCDKGYNSTECGHDGGDCIGVDEYYYY